MNAVFVPKPSGIDIQLHGECVGFQIHTEEFAQFRGASLPFRAVWRDVLGNLHKKRFGRFLPQFHFGFYQFPCQVFRIPDKLQPLILLISARNIQRRFVGRALFFLEDKGSVSRAEQSVGTGDHIEGIIGFLLSRVVNEDDAHARFLGYFFHRRDEFVIPLVAVIGADVTNLLQRVNDDQARVSVSVDEALNLFAQSVAQVVGVHREVKIVCRFRSEHLVHSPLQSAVIILQWTW